MLGQRSVEDLLSPDGRHFADHLELLASMSRDFTFSGDIEATLQRALERIAAYLDAEGGALFLLDDAGKTLTCRVCTGPVDIVGLTLGAEEGIVGRSVTYNHGEIVRDVAADPNFQAAVDRKTGFTTRSILCAPMSVKDSRIGAIEMVNKRGGDGLFSEADLYMLMALSASAALAILNARMAEALVEQEKTRRELELAAEIQRSLLPAPPGPLLPVAGINRPARLVSGDFYDFFELPGGRLCFALGDVSGKGMDAALMMAKTASLFHCVGKTVLQPGRLLALINDELCETVTRGRFVTMVAGIFDPRTGRVRLANAGHEPPLLHRADGTFESWAAEAPPLGIAADVVGDAFPEIDVDLAGGTLYLFTDGVTEIRRGDGLLGVEGLKAMLDGVSALRLDLRLPAVVTQLLEGDEAPRDDVTLLGLSHDR